MIRHRPRVWWMAWMLLGCAHGPRSSASIRAPLFDFHVGFWVNLHQRLYAESGRHGVREPLRAASAADQEIWERAVAVYRQHWRERDLLTLLEDESLVRLNRQLAAGETAQSVPAT